MQILRSTPTRTTQKATISGVGVDIPVTNYTYDVEIDDVIYKADTVEKVWKHAGAEVTDSAILAQLNTINLDSVFGE